LALFAAFAVLASSARDAHAQPQPRQVQGFALDRLYLSAPGAGWFVMDTLDMHGGLGGAMALTTGYEHDPLRVSDGAQRLTVVGDEVLADFGFAATYDRFRLYIDVAMPFVVDGTEGTVGGYQFSRPNPREQYTPQGVNPSTTPDALTDGKVGFDARLLGEARAPFRLGAGAQLFIPSPNTPNSEYLSDGTFRAMGRLLFAGDVGHATYAAQLGVHVRPMDQSPAPESPQGSELLFGFAGGAKLDVGDAKKLAVVIGPEFYGETAFRSFFRGGATGFEGLLSGRLEGAAESGGQLRVRVGAGAGLDARFGAPEWRLVVGVELFDRGLGKAIR
jgi:hypothetical protein